MGSEKQGASEMNGSKMDAFIEIGFTNEQVEATIAAEERLGLRDRKCAFLDDFVPEQVIRTRRDVLGLSVDGAII
jgi:hypothetical protein